ncbi:MAG: hypothetical protein HYS26_03565 [Candidatus Kaiserbacteria bacterium]|nr:MAG: hypothetical protein HYS26_03565 [Candidatus Kaiserbacteria bacterium]
MNFETQEKKKIEYPVLKKALSGSEDDFHMVQRAYTKEELKAHEEKLAQGSWDATVIPEIVAGARARIAEKTEQ